MALGDEISVNEFVHVLDLIFGNELVNEPFLQG